MNAAQWKTWPLSVITVCILAACQSTTVPLDSQIDVPQQFLSALPYIATIVVLVLISRNALSIRLNFPASLGQPFRPDT